MPETIVQPLDAIQIAGQLGRLDFISALLATVALIMVFLAFPLFSFLRNRAEVVAREETSAQMEKLIAKLESEAISKMEEMLRLLVKEYMDLARQQAEVHRADDIARAQEDDGHDDNR